MVEAIAAFTEFCYIIRRDVLDEEDLQQAQEALDNFERLRVVFQETGVRPTGFSLPRMHALRHFLTHVRNFGAPNGLCSSITESKHVKAVKEPYRRSSRFEALGQMLLTNQRLDKLAASRVDFTARGMLEGSCLSHALDELKSTRNTDNTNLEASEDPASDDDNDGDGSNNGDGEDSSGQTTNNTSQAARRRYNEIFGDLRDQGPAADDSVLNEVRLASRAGRSLIA